MKRRLLPVQGGSLEVFVSEARLTTLVTTHPCQYFGQDGGPLAGPLAAIGQAVVVNPRGTGGSSPVESDEDAVQQLVDDLETIRRAIGVSTWVVVGQSAGGYVALLYALCYPDSVAGLILSCTTARGIATDRMSVYHPENSHNATVREERAAGHSSAIRKLVAHQPDLVAEEPSGGFSLERQLALAVELPKLALLSRLHEIAVPTLVVGGRHDRAIPIHHSEELADRISSARLVVFEASGHFPYLEEPVSYSRVLADFVVEVTGQSA